jgi:hypothetical protein
MKPSSLVLCRLVIMTRLASFVGDGELKRCRALIKTVLGAGRKRSRYHGDE